MISLRIEIIFNENFPPILRKQNRTFPRIDNLFDALRTFTAT